MAMQSSCVDPCNGLIATGFVCGEFIAVHSFLFLLLFSPYKRALLLKLKDGAQKTYELAHQEPIERASLTCLLRA